MAFAILAHDFYSGLLLYMLVGLSLGGTYTTGVMIIADQFVPKRRAWPWAASSPAPPAGMPAPWP